MLFIAFALLAIAAVSGTEEKKICEPGASFKDDCNSCICSKDGTFKACTLMLCLPKIPVASTTEQQGTPDDEAIATSTDTSEPASTSSAPLLRGNRQVSHNKPCEAGKRFKIYCNDCTCGSDGFSVACSRMECPEGMYNEDGSLTSS